MPCNCHFPLHYSCFVGFLKFFLFFFLSTSWGIVHWGRLSHFLHQSLPLLFLAKTFFMSALADQCSCCRLPLYHMVGSDLPANTMAPELDDANAELVLRRRRDAAAAADAHAISPSPSPSGAHASQQQQDVFATAGVSEKLMGVYLAYLVAVGFLPPPPPKTPAPTASATTAAVNNAGEGATRVRSLPRFELSEEQRLLLAKAGGRGGGAGGAGGGGK